MAEEPTTDRLPIRMLHDRVLVSQEGEGGERRSGGGIVIPATASMGKRLAWAKVVAIGSNYALFFDRLAAAGESAPRTLASLTLANLTTVASFGVLAVSEIPILHAIGATVAVGAFCALAFSAMLARGGVTIAAGTR